MSILYTINIILVAILLYFGGTWVYYRLRGRQLNGAMSPEDFESTMRKAQIIDTREKSEFDAKHILGARNLPYTQMKMYANELRKDLPVYVYDRSVNAAIRSTGRLKKYGFTDVYWLNQGFSDWQGKTKKTTKL
ncbi:sulfurtransferase [Companilactobacillus sp. RD055328]|uniref:rhodanese-like domain-containing protein n=1 Tax=Companilactobacillus sp. RD055328 TaxID=2916634 RepID=UPI001FC8C497|nr:rhodanese-like domain-containing protein [Companilactobacillus sp. RD055328]GKQ42539.1 sulfurtransferase [Companilactobacillus sp. RD055328]